MAENEFQNTPETRETTPSLLDAKPIQASGALSPTPDPEPAPKPKPRRATRRKPTTKE